MLVHLAPYIRFLCWGYPMRLLQNCIVAAGLFLCLPAMGLAHDDDGKGSGYSPSGIGGNGPYASYRVNLIKQIPHLDMGAGASIIGNDVWGWTKNGREFALVGQTDATAFVEITDPYNPVFLGRLPTAAGVAAWRDMKVYGDYMYVVADGSANASHGVQVFDLNRLLPGGPPQNYTMDFHYTGLGRAHNIAINETGLARAYVVGSPSASSGGGLIILDISNPLNVTQAGVYSGDGYTHDTQVVTYNGPDAGYLGWEVAFSSNEDTLTITDVTNPAASTLISRTGYAGAQYSHQGWLTEDQRYFVMDDELDERNNVLAGNPAFPTRTRIWNVEDLDNPVYLGHIDGVEYTIDHNQYIHNGLIYQANYTSGLRILRINDIQSLDIEEIAFFDTYPTDNAINSFNGAWSAYPFFQSGTIIVNDRQNGLFLLQVIPEPSTWALLLVASGIFVLVVVRKRRAKALAAVRVR